MNLEERIELMCQLATFITKDDEELDRIKIKAFEKNKWFIKEFVDLSLANICAQYLNKEKLDKWVQHYRLDDNVIPQKIGIVMAGNIPLVGFHDFLTVFISGHHQRIKLSDKDDILLPYLIKKLSEWSPEIEQTVQIFENLKDCDAYIATGSNNSSRYFNFYFGRYPSVIRKNKTSVGLLRGNENDEILGCLADDVHTYFGLGCRNVTKIWIPENYDFVPLLNAFRKYSKFSDHSKYRNNYDYNLALLILNNKYYMTNETILLVESENVFSPVAELNYSFYKDENTVRDEILGMENVQCVVGEGYIAFGESQIPGLFDYADGIDTMKFLLGI